MPGSRRSNAERSVSYNDFRYDFTRFSILHKFVGSLNDVETSRNFNRSFPILDITFPNKNFHFSMSLQEFTIKACLILKLTIILSKTLQICSKHVETLYNSYLHHPRFFRINLNDKIYDLYRFLNNTCIKSYNSSSTITKHAISSTMNMMNECR